MRRRANSNGKSSPASEHQPNNIELTNATNKAKNLLSMPHVVTRKRRTHTEMERGSFSSTSSAASAVVGAAKTVATSTDCDLVDGSKVIGGTIGNCSVTVGRREDKEMESLTTIPQQNESPLNHHRIKDNSCQRKQLHIKQQKNSPSLEAGGSSSSFPHIDVNIDANMNIDVSVNMDNFDFDFHALPVEIQMALEDTLLGWTHLTSITLGHILLPWLVFFTVKRTSKYVLESTVYTMVLREASASTSSSPVAMTATTTALEGDFELHAIEAVLVSPTTHVIMGAVAAIAAFRVIRNRRRVWFRHAYGSEGYKQCDEGLRRRRDVLEADQRLNSLLSITSNNNSSKNNASSSVGSTQTWTSQVYTNYKRKRHKKKLQRASDRFERHHTGLTPKHDDTIASISSRANARRQRFLWGNDYDSSAATSVAPTVDDSCDSSSSEDWDEGEIGPNIKEMTSTSTNVTGRIFDSNGNRMSSIAHDAVCIPRINNRPYAHGGFFGAAPFFLADRLWVGILRELLPDVYVEISRRVGGGSGFYFNSSRLGIGNGSCKYNNVYRSDASKLIHWAENNPVVAAYGVVMDLKIKEEIAAIPTNSKANNLISDLTEGCTSKTSTKIDAIHDDGSSGNVIDYFYQNNRGIKSSDGVSDTNASTSSNNQCNIYNFTCTDTMAIPNLEWDIFVDPHLVRRVEAVLDSIDHYVSSKRKTKGISSTSTSIKPNDSADLQIENNQRSLSPSFQENCQLYDDSNGINDGNHIALFDDDEDNSGETEATALLADHEHNNTCNNVINMNMNVNINNLCGKGADDVCSNHFRSKSVPGKLSHQRCDTSSGKACNDNDGSIGRHSLKHDPVLRYLERELERRTQVLTDRLLIAHGNVLQLITEQAGFLKDWNYSRVQRTRRTLGGGMYARQWMAVFAESLRLGMKPSLENFDNTRGERSCSTSCERKDCDKTDSIDDIGIDSEDAEEIHNFYDEDEYDEVDALLSQGQRDQHNNLPGKNPLGAPEDVLNHCTCSPRCCLDTTMEESLRLIEEITQTKQPIGILLDLKSRHVPKRVLTLMVRSLQKIGIRVVGIASFSISDIRGVGCNHKNSENTYDDAQPDFYDGNANQTTPVGQNNDVISRPLESDQNAGCNNSFKEILMVHSAGDLQAACDEGLVRPGDHVFFNGGSLIVDSARSSTLKTLFGFFFDTCACGYYSTFDPCVIEEGYRIQSYGYACSSMDAVESAGCFTNNDPNLMDFNNNNVPMKRKNVNGAKHKANYDYDLNEDGDNDIDESPLLLSSSSDDTEMGAVMKTLADYKKHYGFSMGLYLQEFSIDEAAAKLLINLVNQNPKLYDLGLAWGGINGMTVRGIQPGRFTSTDGYWTQRRLGLNWKDRF